MRCCLQRPTVFLFHCLILIATGGCAVDPASETNSAGEVTSDESPDTDQTPASTDPPASVIPCAFGAPYYTRLGESLDFLIAEDPNNPDCRFTFHFAERMGDNTVADIAASGDVVKIYDIPGFMVAGIDFSCAANSSSRCTADEGEIRLVVFDITADDLMNGTVSGKSVRIEVDARGTKPGNMARLQGVIEGVLP